MQPKLIVILMTLVACVYLSSSALAAPNPAHASCQAILTNPDAHERIRDGLAREFAAGDFPPGSIYSAAARAVGTTTDECETAIGF